MVEEIDQELYLKTYFARKVIEDDREVYLDLWPGLWTLKSFEFPRPYVEVRVREAREREETMYWGWKDFEKKQYVYTAPHQDLVEMCFPYGSKPEEERGKGKLVRLIVEKIRDVE